MNYNAFAIDEQIWTVWDKWIVLKGGICVSLLMMKRFIYKSTLEVFHLTRRDLRSSGMLRSVDW
jgi:hypothetical protein